MKKHHKRFRRNRALLFSIFLLAILLYFAFFNPIEELNKLPYRIIFILLLIAYSNFFAFTIYYYIHYLGIEIHEDSLHIGLGNYYSQLSNEIKNFKYKRWYYFPFGSIDYVDCMRRPDAKLGEWTLVIGKKDGIEYQISWVGYSCKRVKKELMRSFMKYKEQHPDELNENELSKKEKVVYRIQARL